MAENLGKLFEAKFKADWKKSFPNTFIYRLKDIMNGYKDTSGNPCDFLCFPGIALFMVECKEHKGASIPFAAIPQYERLLSYKGLPNVYPGAVIWFSEKDIVVWVSIEEMEKMIKNGEKSIGLRMLENKLYNIIILPSIKKRTYMETDYSILVDKLTGDK